MNKRQFKKRKKITDERLSLLFKYSIRNGRQNGKSNMIISILGMCFKKEYAPYKRFKKFICKNNL